MQTTLMTPLSVAGTGLHSGRPSRVTLREAPAGTGVLFRRTDVVGRDPLVPARWDRVEITPLNTRIVNEAGVHVSTIEHLMAALVGTGVGNALVEIEGPEVPILDGSALVWADAILRAGIRRLDAPQQAIQVLKPVEVRDGAASARLDPAEGFTISFAIDFPDAAIGHQERSLDMAGSAFLRELSDSRTFCRAADLEAMWSQGLALGGTPLNAVVVDGDRVMTPGGWRHADEAVRHKMLDALGDLATAGHPILGAYTGLRAGHGITNKLLRALFAQPDAWRLVTCEARLLQRLPGANLRGAELADLPAVA